MSLRLNSLLGTIVLAIAPFSQAVAESSRLSVVELFTSQGCSSCPPADALLKHYAERKDVIALSFSVDYWDYLGWKDTLASPKFTQRQRAYATKRGDGEVYTPQMVVNGIAHVVGSHSKDIDRAIDHTSRKLSDQHVPIRAAVSGNMLLIDIGKAPTGSRYDMATVWLAVIDPKVEVEVRTGENKGKRMSYLNVVRELSAVGAWTGAEARLELPESALMKPGERGAVLLQAGEGGRIVGAAWVEPR